VVVVLHGCHGWAWNFLSLVVTRALFGAGEAGCFPNLTKSFTTWLPQHERVRAQGIMWLSARWGGAFTPYLVVLTFQFMSWRHAFELFGGLASSGPFSSITGIATIRGIIPA
jgi:MFS family permease